MYYHLLLTGCCCGLFCLIWIAVFFVERCQSSHKNWKRQLDNCLSDIHSYWGGCAITYQQIPNLVRIRRQQRPLYLKTDMLLFPQFTIFIDARDVSQSAVEEIETHFTHQVLLNTGEQKQQYYVMRTFVRHSVTCFKIRTLRLTKFTKQKSWTFYIADVHYRACDGLERWGLTSPRTMQGAKTYWLEEQVHVNRKRMK
jgi:hypothetical protein